MVQREHQPENTVFGLNRSFVPTAPLAEGETEKARFATDPMTFWRTQAYMAAFFMIMAMGVLYGIGNPYWWTGGIGGFAAIAVRALYLGADERREVWILTNQRLLGPYGRIIALSNITAVNVIWTATQVITIDGTKHMIRYQALPEATKAEILTASSASSN